VVVLVVNNRMYGTIRMHQERAYPGRVIATDLVNPDFAALAAAYGAHGEVVEATEAFPDALERALGAGRPALLELRVDPDAISTATTLSALRRPNLGKAPPFPHVDPRDDQQGQEPHHRDAPESDEA
jgi:acetolactate synthase I/II/III large subunit